MKRILGGLVAAIGLLALSTGAAMAQDNIANLNGPSSVVIQNTETSPNSGQQGGDNQIMNSQTGTAGNGSNIVLSGEDASVNAIAAQAPGATAIGEDYIFVDGDAIWAQAGHAVGEGATTVSGGVALGEDVDVDDETALVGGNGVALVSDDESIAEDGAAVVIGSNNITAAGEDDAAVVGHTGSALFVDDADEWSVYGGNNVVSMNELDQEVAVDEECGCAVLSVGAWTPQEGAELNITDPSEPTILTGNIGLDNNGTAHPVSINGMAGLNAFHVNTGAMNQGSVHAVGVLADSIAF